MSHRTPPCHALPCRLEQGQACRKLYFFKSITCLESSEWRKADGAISSAGNLVVGMCHRVRAWMVHRAHGWTRHSTLVGRLGHGGGAEKGEGHTEVARVAGDLAAGEFLPVNGAPLLCLAGAWGRLIAGSHVSVLTVRVGLGAQHRVHLAFCFGSVYSTGYA